MALGPIDGGDSGDGGGGGGPTVVAEGSIDLSDSPPEFTDTGIGAEVGPIRLGAAVEDPTVYGDSFQIGPEGGKIGYSLYWGTSTATWYVRLQPRAAMDTSLVWQLIGF